MTPEQVKLLADWAKAAELAAEAKTIIDNELDLRKKVFAAFFTEPKEGTNTVPLNAGWKLKGVYKLERKIDETALQPVLEKFRAVGWNPDILIKYWPQLITKEYRELTKEQQDVFDQALLVKPQSPGLELLAPKPPKES